jgi:hypothetical protein
VPIRRAKAAEPKAEPRAESRKRPEPLRERQGDMVVIRKAPERIDMLASEPEPEVEKLRSVRRQFQELQERQRAEEERTVPVREESDEERPARRARISRKKVWLGSTVVAVIALATLLSTVFHSAAMTVTVKTAAVNVSGDFTAKKSAAAGGGLAYQVVTAKETGAQEVKASGEKTVNSRASGHIVIYNDYSDVPQRLIKNTRFQTPEGLVFRISDSVTVPGKTSKGPGSIDVVVYADEAGDKYNVGLKDFTIPGFKGDPRFQTIYARSKTPLAGGFSGIQKVVADADRAKAKVAIEADLKAKLLEKARASVAPGAVFFDNAYVIDFKDLPDEAVSSSAASIREEATISAAVFAGSDLGAAIGKAAGQDVTTAPTIKDPSKLSFIPKGDFNPGAADSIQFSLKGPIMLEWGYDELALKEALKGKSRSQIPAALAAFPVIQKADISIRPFWRRTFPDSLGSISITKAE